MQSDDHHHRLERIETKIDQLSEAFVVLARTEEKIINMEKDRSETITRFRNIEKKLEDVERKSDENGRTTEFIKKLFWVLMATGATVLATQYFT